MNKNPFLCPYCDTSIFQAKRTLYLELEGGAVHNCPQMIENDRARLERCFAKKAAVKMPPAPKRSSSH